MHNSRTLHGHHGRHQRTAHREHPCIRVDRPPGGGVGRRERVFSPGDLKFVMLHLLTQKPGHGYDLIKSLSDLVGGDYSPSPGTIYPTLTLLDDLGWVAVEQDVNGRKVYRVTPDGEAKLDEVKDAVERILTHLGHRKARANARRTPEIFRAMENLKLALRIRLGDSTPDRQTTRRIAEIIDCAAVEIERV